MIFLNESGRNIEFAGYFEVQMDARLVQSCRIITSYRSLSLWLLVVYNIEICHEILPSSDPIVWQHAEPYCYFTKAQSYT